MSPRCAGSGSTRTRLPCEIRVVVVARHLQHHEAADQEQRERGDDAGRRHRAALENPLLAPVILDAHRTHAR